MARNKLFQELNLNHQPKRNGYDLSEEVDFTSRAGELLPIWHRTVMPGDSIKLNISAFTRTSPAESQANVQVREYFDVFFVPYRLLWKNSKAVIMQNQRNPDIAQSQYSNVSVGEYLPRISLGDIYGAGNTKKSIIERLSEEVDEFGRNRAIGACKLLNHLGYGYITADEIKSLYLTQPPQVGKFPFRHMPNAISMLPILAYNKIYYDYYRNQQWETNQPYNYNVDYLGTSALMSYDTAQNPNGFWDNPTPFDLRYTNYPKDLFFGLMPESQYGDPATVDVDVDFNGISTPTAFVKDADGRNVVVGNAISGNGYSINGEEQGGSQSLNSGTNLSVQLTELQSSLNSLKANFTILNERKGRFLQKYREIIGSGKNDYQALVKKIFGVDIPDTLADHCTYLGGNSSDIKFSEVVNTNLSGDNQADIQGKGIGTNRGDMITFEPKEHGVIMVMYHCQPVIQYALNAAHFDVVKTEADDFANPVFDQLGFQELPYYFLNVGTLKPGDNFNEAVATPTLGYTTRYFDYKTSISRVLGDLRESRPNWLAPVNLDYLGEYAVQTGSQNGSALFKFEINSTFFKVNPSILDPVFFLKSSDYPYVNGDQFTVFCNIECNMVRPLDYYGVPF